MGTWLVAITAAMVVAPVANAQTSTGSIGLQAKLTGVADGLHTVTVRFYESPSGGSALETVVVPGVLVTSGLFSTAVPVTTTIFDGASRWWAAAVDAGPELSPRTLVSTVPYAIRAATILNPSGMANLSNGSGTARLGINTTPEALLHVQQYVQEPQAVLIQGRLLNEPAPPVVVFTFEDLDDASDIKTGGVAFLEKHADAQHRLIKAFYEDDAKLLLENNGDLWLRGDLSTTVLEIRGGSDVAEPVGVTTGNGIAKALTGMVMVIDRDHDGKLVPCSSEYDKAVAGVLSGANGLCPGMVLSAEGQQHTAAADDTMPLAMVGRVWVLCDATRTPVRRGDALTTSATPGHAMGVTDDSKRGGTVIGKAMTELKEGKGLVLVLVNLQ
ncbi:MAG: hypothetical protein H7Y88_06550 [Phycisphaerales bacterium]|nr:hypothetical protein [Phycisphaerales bacterium]